MKVEFVSYTGKYPNLCSGNLTLLVNGIKFTGFSLSSNGRVWFDDDWNEHIAKGSWEVDEWPANFPEEAKKEALEVINENIEHGCCGGCI